MRPFHARESGPAAWVGASSAALSHPPDCRCRRSCGRPRLAATGRMARRSGGEFAADDEVHDLLDIGVLDAPFRDVATLIHHLDTIADQEEVLQTVGDQDNGDA